MLTTALVLATAGCSSIEHSADSRPAAPVHAVAVGGFDSTDPDRQRIARRFRRELAARLRDSEAFKDVLLPPPVPLPADAVLITGRLLEVGDSSDVLRFVAGSGYGAGHVRAYVELRDAGGRTLAAFEDSAHSADGMLSMAPGSDSDAEEMAEAMAGGTANAIIRWSKGKGLEPSLWQRLF